MKIKQATFITSAASPSQFVRSEKPIIAVVGKSNVGKSSFINAVAGQNKLARTSDSPGRTKLINYFDFGAFILADLPGYGYAKVSKAEKEKWGRTMDAFFADKSNVDYVISLLDIRHEPTKDDVLMVNYLHLQAYSYFFVGTKADKISRMNLNVRKKEICKFLKVTEDKLIPFSSVTKSGKDEVFAKLEEIVFAVNEIKGVKS
ncbi:MAG: YihA family ribosome biogenesis GTP-binding protein [Clostridia bacterium]|nr:YihA family ribosome biogenesis GTP-binding protein [Clostridia bacterium]